MRGIPYYLLKEYLQELGGTLHGEDLIQGDGWSVKIEKMEPFRLFSLSVGQSRLTMELEERVAGTGEARHHAEIGLIPGCEHNAVLAVEELRQLRL